MRSTNEGSVNLDLDSELDLNTLTLDTFQEPDVPLQQEKTWSFIDMGRWTACWQL